MTFPNRNDIPSPLAEASSLALPAFVDQRPLSRKVLVASAAGIVLLYALLWSPWWYPLSDSGLYLSLGRSLADGHGYLFSGQVNRLAAPVTPINIAIVFRLGGGIGTLHTLMICYLLIGHLLAFLTLKRWLGERLALGCVLGAAISFWLIQGALTIMTEPLCYALFWATLLTLSIAEHQSRRWPRGLLMGLALLLMMLNFQNRAAMVLLLPGILLILWKQSQELISLREKVAWILIYSMMLGISYWDYRHEGRMIACVSYLSKQLAAPVSPVASPTPRARARTVPAKVQQPLSPSATVESTVNATTKTPAESRERYQVELPKVDSVTSYPFYFGRWICEALVAPSVILFKTNNFVISTLGIVVSLGALVAATWGGWVMISHRRWWCLAPIGYILPIWLMWADRIIPRYMIPILPILVLFVWVGLCKMSILASALWQRENTPRMKLCAGIMVGMLGLIFVGNLPALVLEIYLRHAPNVNYYQLARRGSVREIFDISEYIDKYAEPNEVVVTNAYFFHRVIHYLTTQPVKVVRFTRAETQSNLHPRFGKTGSRFIVLFVQPNTDWPMWHYPLVEEQDLRCWWKLYELQVDGKYALIDPKAEPLPTSLTAAKKTSKSKSNRAWARSRKPRSQTLTATRDIRGIADQPTLRR